MLSLLINQMCDLADQYTSEGKLAQREGVRECISLASTIFFRSQESLRRFKELPATDIFERLATFIPDVVCFRNGLTGEKLWQTGQSYKSSSYQFDSVYEMVIAKLRSNGAFNMPKRELEINEKYREFVPFDTSTQIYDFIKADQRLNESSNNCYMPIAKRYIFSDELLAEMKKYGYSLCIVKNVSENILGADDRQEPTFINESSYDEYEDEQVD